MSIRLFSFTLVLAISAASAYEIDPTIKCKPKCPEGFFSFINKCYVIPRITQTWGDALEFCQSFDADLLRIDNQEEQSFLMKTLHYHHGKDFWIAATDLVAEGDWRWANTLGPVLQKWWLPKQPDDRLNREGHRQHCVALSDRTGYRWHDEDCVQHYHFICEREIN